MWSCELQLDCTHRPVLFALGGLSISSARIPISTATPALLPGIVGEQERYFNQEQEKKSIWVIGKLVALRKMFMFNCCGGGDYGFLA